MRVGRGGGGGDSAEAEFSRAGYSCCSRMQGIGTTIVTVQEYSKHVWLRCVLLLMMPANACFTDFHSKGWWAI